MIDTECNFDSELTSRRASYLDFNKPQRLGFWYWLLDRVN